MSTSRSFINWFIIIIIISLLLSDTEVILKTIETYTETYEQANQAQIPTNNIYWSHRPTRWNW